MKAPSAISIRERLSMTRLAVCEVHESEIMT